MADDSQNTNPDPLTPPPLDAPLPDDDSVETPTQCGDDGEDPEDHLGDVIQDPWDDPFQTDWPQNEVPPA